MYPRPRPRIHFVRSPVVPEFGITALTCSMGARIPLWTRILPRGRRSEVVSRSRNDGMSTGRPASRRESIPRSHGTAASGRGIKSCGVCWMDPHFPFVLTTFSSCGLVASSVFFSSYRTVCFLRRTHPCPGRPARTQHSLALFASSSSITAFIIYPRTISS